MLSTKWISTLSLFAFAGCGGSDIPTAQTPADQEPAEMVSQDDEPPEPAPQPEPVSELPIAERSPNCSGSDLDLAALARSGECNVDDHGSELPSTVSVTLPSAEFAAASGQAFSLDFLFTNQGESPAEIYLDHSCGFERMVVPRLRTSKGSPIGRPDQPQECPIDRACVGQVLHVTLAAGGSARLPVQAGAHFAIVAPSCETIAGRALSPGRYRMELETPFQDKAFDARLRVSKLARLPKAKCGGYARMVGEKAEPDEARRATLVTQVKAKCVASPPSKAFVDCRTAAQDEQGFALCKEGLLPR